MSLAQISSEAGFDAKLFQHLYEAEDKHFWFRARNRVIGAVVEQLAKNLGTRSNTLEVGCGTGNVLRVLDAKLPPGTVTGVDAFAEGLNFARQRVTCNLVQSDIRSLPFATDFDLICMFDVLEHLPNDKESLADLVKLLKPDGRVLLTVPAHQSLWSYFDDISHHYRRYEKSGLENLLTASGLKIEYLTFFQSVTYPLVWLGRRFFTPAQNQTSFNVDEKYKLTLRELKITPVVNEILYALLGIEKSFVNRRWQLPCGTSLLAVARKIA